MFPSRLSSAHPGSSSSHTATRPCQKCLSTSHPTWKCHQPSSARPYLSRPTRSQLLADDKLRRREEEKRRGVTLPEELARKGTADIILASKAKERQLDEDPLRGSQQKSRKTTKLQTTRRSSPSPSSSEDDQSSSYSSYSSSSHSYRSESSRTAEAANNKKRGRSGRSRESCVTRSLTSSSPRSSSTLSPRSRSPPMQKEDCADVTRAKSGGREVSPAGYTSGTLRARSPCNSASRSRHSSRSSSSPRSPSVSPKVRE